MTKKDYILIAEAIKLSIALCKEIESKTKPLDAIKGTAYEIALALQNDNPKFDIRKFLNAIAV
jgi:hypothetical protein